VANDTSPSFTERSICFMLFVDVKNFQIMINTFKTFKNVSKIQKIVPCGTDGLLLLSGFQAVVSLTLTLDRVIRHTIVHQSSTSVYIPNFIEIGKLFGDGLTAGTPPTSRSRDTKTRTNIKHPKEQI